MTNRSAGRLWQEDHAMFYHQSMYLKAIEAIEVIVKGQDGTNTTKTRTKHVRKAFLHSLGMLVGLSIHFILTNRPN